VTELDYDRIGSTIRNVPILSKAHGDWRSRDAPSRPQYRNYCHSSGVRFANRHPACGLSPRAERSAARRELFRPCAGHHHRKRILTGRTVNTGPKNLPFATVEDVQKRASGEVRIRRVGFRSGTDAELAALHAVETPVAAELRWNRMPQPIDSYIAFARNLPSQFNDRAWLAETPEGSPVACGFCWSNSAGDQRAMECDLAVRRDRRREGVGSQLFERICATSADEGRTLLTWTTSDAVPAGEAFSRRLGAQPARANRTSELSLGDVNWQMTDEWTKARLARARGYHLEMIDGVFPEHLRADAVTFHHIMQTAPREDLEVGNVLVGPDDIAELDRALLEAGRLRWTALMRDPTGACVGGTEATFEHWEPALVLQQNTGIDPAHRGLGLAKWAKAAMLDRIRHDRPEAQKIRAGNAFSNAPMLAINDALGFGVIGTRTEWQSNVDDARRALSR
jgi:mycothiol synthase